MVAIFLFIFVLSVSFVVVPKGRLITTTKDTKSKKEKQKYKNRIHGFVDWVPIPCFRKSVTDRVTQCQSIQPISKRPVLTDLREGDPLWG